MRQGGEALPPLPLPVTPLRRSEKKRPPSPATLIGKVIWGSHKDFTWENGQTTRVHDWNMVPAECRQLLKVARRFLNMDYRVETVSLDSFAATPAEIPVLYLSGGRRLRFTDAERELLRNYMLAGGMVWFDSVVGSPYFYASAASELARIMPESGLRRLPPDHPVFHMIDDAVSVSVQSKQGIAPVLDGLYVGSRLAAIVSPYGLGCGWDNATPHRIARADYYDRRSAVQLGLNLVAYAVGYFRVGQAHARAEVYRDQDLVDNPDAVVFAQIRTNGVWNTEPGAAANLLRFMSGKMAIKANVKRRTVALGEESLDGLPFLYLTGITDFTLADPERAALRRYVLDGGRLIVDNSLGLSEFLSAARRELEQTFPGLALRPLPRRHTLFTQGPFAIDTVGYTLAVQAQSPDLKTPVLEGLTVDGDLRVVLSPYDLAAGWQGDDHPLARGYAPPDAMKLGTNLITYFLTH